MLDSAPVSARIFTSTGEKMNQNSHPVHPDVSEEMWGKIDKIIANG
jgi:hypothetical protein